MLVICLEEMNQVVMNNKQTQKGASGVAIAREIMRQLGGHLQESISFVSFVVVTGQIKV